MGPGSQRGSALIELVVGGAVALLALGLVIQMQISAYRAQHLDSERFNVQMEAANALDRMARDLRMASSVIGLDPDGGESSSIALEVGGRTIHYSFRPGTGEVVRTENGVEQVVGHRVATIAFKWEEGAVGIKWVAELSDGSLYVLSSRVSPRVAGK